MLDKFQSIFIQGQFKYKTTIGWTEPVPIAGSEQVAIMFEKRRCSFIYKKQQLIRRITIALIQQKEIKYGLKQKH